MVTTSYPRFPGDSVGTFMEPIAKSVAARGHEVHVVAPWHPLVTRSGTEDGVTFHFYKYAPPRPLEEIETEIADLEKDIVRMLREVVG